MPALINQADNPFRLLIVISSIWNQHGWHSVVQYVMWMTCNIAYKVYGMWMACNVAYKVYARTHGSWPLPQAVSQCLLNRTSCIDQWDHFWFGVHKMPKGVHLNTSVRSTGIVAQCTKIKTMTNECKADQSSQKDFHGIQCQWAHLHSTLHCCSISGYGPWCWHYCAVGSELIRALPGMHSNSHYYTFSTML